MSVSYLITLYNKEDFIGNVIDAVLAEQAETGGEIIVYDDVSIDRSSEILQDHISMHPQQLSSIKVIRGDRNRGVGYATNRLIELATQPYSRLVDADDVLVRGSTANLLRLLREHKLGFIHGFTTEVGNHDTGLETQKYETVRPLVNPTRRILRHTIAGTSPSLFVTEELRKSAPVPEWIKRTQDFLITLRVAYRGTPMGQVTDVVSIGPSDRTGNNLSASLAAMFAEMSRDVAHDGNLLPLKELRYAARRYSARTAKYFRRRGHSKLTAVEKFKLWLWQQTSPFAPRQMCIERLSGTADLLERDRNVLITGPAR